MQANIKYSQDIVLLEEGTEEQAFLHGVLQGLMDIEDGREISLTDVKKRLGFSK